MLVIYLDDIEIGIYNITNKVRLESLDKIGKEQRSWFAEEEVKQFM